MSNKRFRRSHPVENQRSAEGLWIGIGAGLLGAVVFIATLIYDAINPSTASATGVRPIIFAIPAAVVGAMLGSLLTPRPPARRK